MKTVRWYNLKSSFSVLIGCALFVSLLLACSLINRADTGGISDCNDANLAFVNALISNDVNSAKALVTPDLWDHIDQWAANREGFSCPFSLDLDDQTWFMAGFDVNYSCSPKRYTFSSVGFILKQAQNGCQVVEWGRACEKGRNRVKYCE